MEVEKKGKGYKWKLKSRLKKNVEKTNKLDESKEYEDEQEKMGLVPCPLAISSIQSMIRST